MTASKRFQLAALAAILLALGGWAALGEELTAPQNRETPVTWRARNASQPVAYGSEIAVDPDDPTDLKSYIDSRPSGGTSGPPGDDTVSPAALVADSDAQKMAMRERIKASYDGIVMYNTLGPVNLQASWDRKIVLVSTRTGKVTVSTGVGSTRYGYDGFRALLVNADGTGELEVQGVSVRSQRASIEVRRIGQFFNFTINGQQADWGETDAFDPSFVRGKPARVGAFAAADETKLDALPAITSIGDRLTLSGGVLSADVQGGGSGPPANDTVSPDALIADTTAQKLAMRNRIGAGDATQAQVQAVDTTAHANRALLIDQISEDPARAVVTRVAASIPQTAGHNSFGYNTLNPLTLDVAQTDENFTNQAAALRAAYGVGAFVLIRETASPRNIRALGTVTQAYVTTFMRVNWLFRDPLVVGREYDVAALSFERGVAEWAEEGNTDTVPAPKLPDIPEDKLDNAFKLSAITQAAYDALATKDARTVYITTAGSGSSLRYRYFLGLRELQGKVTSSDQIPFLGVSGAPDSIYNVTFDPRTNVMNFIRRGGALAQSIPLVETGTINIPHGATLPSAPATNANPLFLQQISRVNNPTTPRDWDDITLPTGTNWHTTPGRTHTGTQPVLGTPTRFTANANQDFATGRDIMANMARAWITSSGSTTNIAACNVGTGGSPAYQIGYEIVNLGPWGSFNPVNPWPAICGGTGSRGTSPTYAYRIQTVIFRDANGKARKYVFTYVHDDGTLDAYRMAYHEETTDTRFYSVSNTTHENRLYLYSSTGWVLLGGSSSGTTPADGSVSTAKIIDGAVTAAKIAAGNVNLSKLATDVPRWKGTWTGGTSYSAGDYAEHSGEIVIALVSNSDATFAPSKWIRAYDRWQGAWAAGTFGPGDIVSHASSIYICIVARTSSNTQNPATDTASWKLLSGSGRLASVDIYTTAENFASTENTNRTETIQKFLDYKSGSSGPRWTWDEFEWIVMYVTQSATSASLYQTTMINTALFSRSGDQFGLFQNGVRGIRRTGDSQFIKYTGGNSWNSARLLMIRGLR